MCQHVMDLEKWRDKYTLKGASGPDLEWHLRYAKRTKKPSACLVEMPTLPSHLQIFLNAFSMLQQSENFSMANIQDVHAMFPLLPVHDFVDVMLAMRTANNKAQFETRRSKG